MYYYCPTYGKNLDYPVESRETKSVFNHNTYHKAKPNALKNFFISNHCQKIPASKKLAWFKERLAPLTLFKR